MRVPHLLGGQHLNKTTFLYISCLTSTDFRSGRQLVVGLLTVSGCGPDPWPWAQVVLITPEPHIHHLGSFLKNTPLTFPVFSQWDFY